MKKLLSWILVMAMVLSMFVGQTAGVFADSPNPEKVTAKVYGHNAFFADIDLFKSNANGDLVDNADLLDGITPESDTYTVEVDPGFYLIEGKKADGEEKKSLGKILVNISEPNQELNLCAVIGIKAGNSGWVRGEDYDTAVTVEDKNRTARAVTFSEALGQLSCLALEGDTVTAVFTPKENHPDYLQASVSKTLNANLSGLSASMQKTVTATITAPAGSVIDMGSGPGNQYYVYQFYQPKNVESNAEGVTFTFKVPVNTDVFYRVQNPNGVSYWDYVKFTTDSAVSVSPEALFMGDANFGKSTVDRSLNPNKYDLANIYLNGNSAGYINLASVGDTYELNCFRNWMAIESFMNQKVALPDMHYRVIDFAGEASNSVITVTPSEKNSSVAEIKAVGEGTAVVLVTYDAMFYTGGNGGFKQFSAIWPEFTGVLVISVGEDGTDIDTNMNMVRPGADPSVLDAEHDIFFYTGDEGATYSFTPEAGATVSIARPTVSSSLTYNGFTTEGINTDADGKVTVTGLKTGRSIVKVEKAGKANYQVITARQVSYTMTDAEGNPFTDSNKPKAGEKVKIQFSNLVNPAEKLSGVYNFNASLFYTGEDGSTFKSNPGGGFGVYDFTGNPERQRIEITIPKYFPRDSYSLTGCIKMGGFGSPIGAHRGITYATGKNPDFNAKNVGMILSELPEINIQLAETTFLTGKITFKDDQGNSAARTALTVNIKDADGNAIELADDGTFKGVAETFYYEIAGDGYARKTGTFEMTDTGSNEFEIVLTKLAHGAWNGTAATEPAKEGDIYQVTNGAELAWIAQESTKQDIKAKLVNDIELGGYPWIAKATSSSKTFIFDGNGKTVSGLNAEKGLFGAIGKDSLIKDLTVRGESSGGGGIVGYINGSGGKVENCVSYVNITSENNTVGGVVGYASDNTLVKKCINYGNVTGKEGVGGIIGGFVGNCTVEECINHGNVKCTSKNAGGIFGDTGYPAIIKNCYNKGSVEGTGAVGGIGGQVAGGRQGNPAISNCYSCGTVTGDASFGAFGTVAKATMVSNNAYLATAGNEDSNAAALSEVELKSYDFGEAFTLACRRYPALTWEEGITLHVPTGEAIVVPPSCLVGGYTEHVCAICGETYRDTYTAPLGHLRGDDAVEDDYKVVYTCQRCHEVITEWKDARFEFMTLKAPEIKAIRFVDANEYKWNWNKHTSRYESGNPGEDSTTAETTLNFTVVSAGSLSFDYGVSSETNYDKLFITLNKGDAEVAKAADGVSGEVATTYAISLEPGTYSLVLKYTKDSGAANGKDLGFIGNLAFAVAAGGEGGGTGTGGEGGGTPPAPQNTIRVTMRLIGAEKATKDVDLGTAKYLPNYVTWIATTEYELPKGSTVYDLWVKATEDAGIRSEGAGNNYVSAVYAPDGYKLSEMTNGSRSGWMYTINGKHPNLGLREQTLKAKDKVVWHYVNDYSYEVDDWEDSSKYPSLGDGTYYNLWLKAADRVGAAGGGIGLDSGSSSSKDKNNATSGETQIPDTARPTAESTAKENVETTATVKDGKATAEVKTAEVTKAIEKVATVKTEAKEVVLTVKAEGQATAKVVETSIPQAAVKDLAKAEVVTAIKTDCGNIEIPAKTMENIAKQAGNSALKVTVESKQPEDAAKAAGGSEKIQQEAGISKEVLDKADVVDVNVKAGSKSITSFGGEKISLLVPLTGNQEVGKSYKGVAISEDGSMEPMSAKCVNVDGKKYGELESPHLTTFVVTNVPACSFTDIDGHWASEAVKYVYEKGLMSGVSNEKFAPNSNVTRGMLVTVLYRMAGAEKVSATGRFSDVASGKWYADAVNWAAEKGIVSGISKTSFAPETDITREQLAAILCRYAKMQGKDVTAAANLEAFKDNGKISSWALSAMQWAKEEGFISGTSDDTLSPQATATRGQIATILQRFCQQTDK